MKNNPFTRFLSVALTAVMLVGVMPGAVLADAGEAIVGASSAVVESIPESTTPADAAPVATEVPPVTEPEATPETTQEPEAIPEATEQPEATPEATEEPEATPEATEQPEATPEATQEPEATPEATEEPEATPEATEEPETSPEPTEEPVELNEEAYTVTVDVTDAQGVTVTVKVPANTLPDGVNLVAEMLAEDTQAHADAEAALAEAEVQYDGMIAMDIRFEDAEGNEVEPANEVEVSIDAQALLPEDADPETVAVQHLKEDENGAVTVETVADAAPVTGDITVAENAEQPALNMASTFEVSGFSTFTITWDGNDKSETFSIVDMQGNPLPIAGSDKITFSFDQKEVRRTFVDVVRELGIERVVSESGEEYVFQRAVYVDANGNKHPVDELEIVNMGTSIIKIWSLRMYDAVYEGENGIYTLKDSWPSDPAHSTQLVYRKAEEADPGEVVTETELQRTKTVTKNSEGTYDLELTVSGAVGNITNPEKVDIVFVVDTSNSMDKAMNGGNPNSSNGSSRTQLVGEAVSNLVNSLEENPLLDVQYSLVHFSTRLNTATKHYQDAIKSVGWTDQAQEIINAAYSTSRGGGGTNYQAGLVETRALLLDTRPDALRYVIFLSDGEPTACYNGNGDTAGGDGYNETQADKDAAYAEAGRLQNLNGFFSIGVGSSAASSYTLDKLCDSAQAASHGQESNFKYYPAAENENLIAAFNEIQGNITQILCDYVTVTDTLSEYVQPVSGAQPLLTVTDAEGNPAAVPEDKVGASYENGVLKINFAPDYKLEAGYTYKVTMQIEPTQKAYNEYALTGYPATGDANTGDYARLPGFRSNKEASVTYTYNGTDQSNKYPHPVVQIEPQTLTIEKTVDGLEGTDLQTLENQLTFAVTLDGQSKEYKLSAFTKTSTGKYQLTISNLMPGTEYSVTEDLESAKVPLYDLTMMPIGGVQSGTIAKGTNTASFTNTYEPSVGDLTIVKQLSDSATADKTTAFLFQIEGEGKVYYASVVLKSGANRNDTIIKNLPAGDYTVTEILCPSGYVVGTQAQLVTVSGASASIAFTNSKSSEPDDPTKDDGVVINQFTYEERDGVLGWFWNRVGG